MTDQVLRYVIPRPVNPEPGLLCFDLEEYIIDVGDLIKAFPEAMITKVKTRGLVTLPNINVDIQRATSMPDFVLDMPIVIGTMNINHANVPVILDGHHRAAKARVMGRTWLPAYIYNRFKVQDFTTVRQVSLPQAFDIMEETA